MLMSRPTPHVAPTRVAWGLAWGRLATGVSFIATPSLSVTMLGVDSVTAKRVTFLARMAAARDGALAVGLARALRRGDDATGWLVGSAVCDAVDAVAIAAAIKAGYLNPVRAGAVVAVAAGAAAAGVWVAQEL